MKVTVIFVRTTSTQFEICPPSTTGGWLFITYFGKSTVELYRNIHTKHPPPRTKQPPYIKPKPEFLPYQH